MTYFTVLLPTYLASYVTVLSVLPEEVVPPCIPIEELTRSSSVSNMLPEAVSEALGISLSEVHARYFGPSNTGSDIDRIMAEERFSL
jgi:hypothetical protein